MPFSIILTQNMGGLKDRLSPHVKSWGDTSPIPPPPMIYATETNKHVYVSAAAVAMSTDFIIRHKTKLKMTHVPTT